MRKREEEGTGREENLKLQRNGTLSTAARSSESVKKKQQTNIKELLNQYKIKANTVHIPPAPEKIGIFEARILHLSCDFYNN